MSGRNNDSNDASGTVIELDWNSLSGFHVLGVVIVFLVFLVPGEVAANPGDASIDTDSMDIPPDVAIQVEEDTISRADFRGRVEKRFERVKETRPIPDTVPMERVREGVKQTILKQIVNRLVVKHHALKSGLTAPDTMVEKAFQTSVDEAGSREKFERQLMKHGSSVREHREKIRRKILMRRYLEENVAKPKVSENEIRRVYDANKSRLNSSYEEMKTRLRKMIRKKKYERATAKLVRKLRKKTVIKANIQDL